MGLEPNNRIDDESLYGTFNESVRQTQSLANKAAHKALNLPMDDEMQINTTDNRVTNNYGAKKPGGTLLKLALAAGLAATGVGIPASAYFVIDAIRDMEKPAPVTPASTTDSDTLFDLELVD
ncbi:MAG: hypothetical protein QM501_01870 [Gimesia sp.]